MFRVFTVVTVVYGWSVSSPVVVGCVYSAVFREFKVGLVVGCVYSVVWHLIQVPLQFSTGVCLPRRLFRLRLAVILLTLLPHKRKKSKRYINVSLF